MHSVAWYVPPILNAQRISKSYGAEPLFEEISFVVSENDRVGLIGPNGSGKSTLLRVLAGLEPADSGEVSIRRLAKVAIVYQDSHFRTGATVRAVIESALTRANVAEEEQEAVLAETLGRAGFSAFNQEANQLSGGWRKRLAIAEALVLRPDVLLLDEPTNHLDLEAIEWLEGLLARATFACVVVSHDRYFLETVANETIELNRHFAEGVFRVRGNYSEFLVKKEEFLETQAQRQASLENRVKAEIEWLRRGPKARTSKSKARIDKAHELIGDLSEMNARMPRGSAGIEFSASERKTKRLIELVDVGYEIGTRKLFEGVDVAIRAKARVGLVGPNGSGKTTVLRLLRGELAPTTGEVKRAESLRIVYFEQNRTLDPTITLKQALAPYGDSVIYQDRVIHVASWASRFLFSGEQLVQPVGRLSGGERARVLIAKLMLEPADVLLLDEPTNDLDIPTLEVLEKSLLEFDGALVLVTHDRYLLDRVSETIVGLDGEGGAGVFADYLQWERWIGSRREQKTSALTAKPTTAAGDRTRKKLSYIEQREYDGIEAQIASAEEGMMEVNRKLADPAIASDATRLLALQEELHAAQSAVDRLYARWAELEGKVS
ncbi:MAG: ABC-F family ATP-binding cassette domain-containing protein [Acidobacteriaceae bacterium]